MAGCRVRGAEHNSAWRVLLKKVTIIFITIGLRPNNREETKPYPSTEDWINIYLPWPLPSEQDPVSPKVRLSH